MSLPRQFSVFFGVGVVALIVDYATMVLLKQVFGLDPALAVAFSYIVGGIISYILNRRHTFETDRSHVQAGWRFATVMIVGFSLTVLFEYLFADVLGLQYFVARVLTTGIVFFWNFVAHRGWTFSASR